MGKSNGFRVRSIHEKRFKVWHGVLALVLVFGMGMGFTFSSRTSAFSLPGGFGDGGDAIPLPDGAREAARDAAGDARREAREVEREAREVEHANPPAAAVGRDHRVRPVERGAEDFSRGVDLGPNRATETPGTLSQPVPRFSGLDAPWWINANGPAEIPDDSILHGLVDVRAGLINNDPNKIVLPGAPAPSPAPAPAPAPAPTPAPAPAPAATLTISLAADTPAATSVARGTSAFNAAKINFTASGGDVTVTQIRLTRSGISTQSDIFITCLVEGTNPPLACPIQNDVEAGRPTNYTASFLNWVVRDGQTRTLTVQANVTDSAAIGNTFRLGIQNSADVIVQTGTVSGTAIGNTSTITAPAPAPPLTIALATGPAGTPAAGNVNPGKTAHIATKVNFTAPPGNPANITAIVVTRSGTAADTFLQNVKIFDDSTGTQLGSANLASGVATFNLTPAWSVLASQTKTLRINTDVSNSAVVGTNFQLGIAAGAVATYPILPLSGLPVNGNLFTVSPHLSVAFANTPPGGSVQAGSDVDIALVNFYAQPGNNVVLHDVTINLNGNANSTDVPFMALYDGSTQQLVSDFRSAIVLNDGSVTYPIVLNPVGQGITISQGSTKALTVRARIAAGAVVGKTLAARIVSTANVTATVGSYGGGTASVGGTFPINGNTFTIAAAPAPPAQPNLVPVEFSITPTDTVRQFILSGKTRNAANVPTNADSTLRFCVNSSSSDACLNSGNGYVYQHAVGALNANTTMQSPLTHTWTAATDGSYAVHLCVDARNGSPAAPTPGIAESNEADNCATQPIVVRPDLITQSLTGVPASSVIVGNRNFSVTVKNQGNVPAGHSSGTRLQIDTGNNGSWDVTLADQSTGNLAAAGTEIETWTWNATAGTHKIRVCADAGPVITESDEGNNCTTSGTFTVNTVDPNPGAVGGGDGMVEVGGAVGGFGGGGFGGEVAPNILGLDSVLNLDFFESSNDVSPLDYFFSTAHAAPLIENLDLPIAVELLSKGQKGTVRLPANQLSAIRTLVEENTIDKAQEKELNALIIPENVLLTLPEKAALGRLIPAAKKSGGGLPGLSLGALPGGTPPKAAGADAGAGPAGVRVRGITLYNPVTIHDDLWVRGSGNPDHEPGNLVVNGRIVAYDGTLNVEGSILATGEIRSARGVNLGDVGAETQINGDFSVVGGTTTLGFTKLTGPLTALNGGTISGQFNVLGPSSFGEALFVGTTTVNSPFIVGGLATFIGNAVAEGTLTVNGNAAFGAAVTVAGALTASGAFTAAGNTALAATTISGLLTANNSTIMNKDLTVYENAVFKKDIEVGGNIKAAKIGAYYRVDSDKTPTLGSTGQTITAQCGGGDILVSCSGAFSNQIFHGTNMNGVSCTASGSYASGAKATSKLKVQAVCFNPNRDDSHTIADPKAGVVAL